MTWPLIAGPDLRKLAEKTIRTNRLIEAARKWRQEQYQARKAACQAKLAAELAAKKESAHRGKTGGR